MAPKKKGKKKDDGKKKDGEKKKKADSAKAEPIIPMEENLKDFYQVQVQSLRKKVDELQQECDSYLVSQHTNGERLETLKEIRLGSRAFLGRQMDEINLEINLLNRQLKELNDLKEAERNEFLKQIYELRTRDLQETRDKNESENQMLKAKLNSLDELKTKKESLFNEIKQLDEKLKQQEHDQQEELYYKEKESILEKDKLRKEMVARVNDLSSEFRRVSKMQVVQTTRQIILENVRLNNQMAIIESDYNNVEIENGKIREQKKSKSLELSLLDERERMMAKKNRKTYQLIEKLTEECSAHEQFIATLDEKIASFDYTQQLIDELEEVNTNTDARRYQIYEENESLRRTIAQRKETLSQCEHDMEKAKYPIEKTIQALNDVLQDSSDTSNTGRTIDTRLGAFENIFRLLNVATQLGIGPNLKELAVKNEDDLLATTIDYDSLPSAAQPLGSLKKLKTKSVAIQTNISNRNPVPYHIQTDVSAVRPKSLPFRKRRPSLLST
ncbi:unnamed protein product [Adineta steineri]|uniref:Cilia- and flagella-associated protein 157 n=2 Tax=Adineta steineri TaxID=433720 RepID=A0A818X5T7_9BILA|nr:unnamed protein product [Adineta steineri]